MLGVFGSLRISHKIPLLVIISSLLLALAIGVTNYFQARELAHNSNLEKLRGVLSAKEVAITDYLEGVSADLESLATNKTVGLAMSKLNRQFKKVAKKPEQLRGTAQALCLRCAGGRAQDGRICRQVRLFQIPPQLP